MIDTGIYLTDSAGAAIAGRSPVPIPPTMGIKRVRVLKKVEATPVPPSRPAPAAVAAPVRVIRDPNAPVVIVPESMRRGDQPPL